MGNSEANHYYFMEWHQEEIKKLIEKVQSAITNEHGKRIGSTIHRRACDNLALAVGDIGNEFAQRKLDYDYD